jgi:hypothetical protein
LNWYKLIKLSGQSENSANLLLKGNPNKDFYLELLKHYPPKLQPLIAYFLNQNINQNQIIYTFNIIKKLLENNKITISFNGNVPQIKNQSFTDWIKFEEYVDAIYHNEYFKQLESKDEKVRERRNNRCSYY